MSLLSRVKKIEEQVFPSPVRKFKVITLYGDEEFKEENIDENTDILIVRVIAVKPKEII